MDNLQDLLKKVFLWIRGEYEKDFQLLYPKGLKKILAVFLGKILSKLLKIESKYSLTFVTGQRLLEKYQNSANRVYKIYPSLVSVNDILSKSEIVPTTKLVKIDLLTVGRLTPEKGLEYLIKAIPLVIEKISLPLKLTIVVEREDLKGLLKN